MDTIATALTDGTAGEGISFDTWLETTMPDPPVDVAEEEMDWNFADDPTEEPPTPPVQAQLEELLEQSLMALRQEQNTVTINTATTNGFWRVNASDVTATVGNPIITATDNPRIVYTIDRTQNRPYGRINVNAVDHHGNTVELPTEQDEEDWINDYETPPGDGDEHNATGDEPMDPQDPEDALNAIEDEQWRLNLEAARTVHANNLTAAEGYYEVKKKVPRGASEADRDASLMEEIRSTERALHITRNRSMDIHLDLARNMASLAEEHVYLIAELQRLLALNSSLAVTNRRLKVSRDKYYQFHSEIKKMHDKSEEKRLIQEEQIADMNEKYKELEEDFMKLLRDNDYLLSICSIKGINPGQLEFDYGTTESNYSV